MPKLKIYHVDSIAARLHRHSELGLLVFAGRDNFHDQADIIVVAPTKVAALARLGEIEGIPKYLRAANLRVSTSTPTAQLKGTGLLDTEGDVLVAKDWVKDSRVIRVRGQQLVHVATWRYESGIGGRGLYIELEG